MIEITTSLNLLVFSHANSVFALAGSYQLVTGELSDDFDWWIAHLFLDQLVAFLRDDGLDGGSVHSLFLELFANLELNG